MPSKTFHIPASASMTAAKASHPTPRTSSYAPVVVDSISYVLVAIAQSTSGVSGFLPGSRSQPPDEPAGILPLG